MRGSAGLLQRPSDGWRVRRWAARGADYSGATAIAQGPAVQSLTEGLE